MSAVFIFAATGVPIYLCTKLTGKTRTLTLVFATFILVHGFYHVSVVLGFEFLGEGVLEPLSVLLLISFGLLYLNLTRKNSRAKGSNIE
ncbi:MAG: hypothetical protein M1368_00940 [Thaumarchaeota archaeon]|nr:hypothetical protein [Nitrososphaerota archaeon]